MIGEMIEYPMAITEIKVIIGNNVPHATLEVPYLTPYNDRGVLLKINLLT